MNAESLLEAKKRLGGGLALALLAVSPVQPQAETEGPAPVTSSPAREWTNSLGMEFVWIPAGSFVMGAPEGEVRLFSPDDWLVWLGVEWQCEVRISRGFWLGKYEVTQGEWEAVMGANPSYFSECGSRCPVESVSWEDVQEFIGELNRRESGMAKEYRLPSSAEWEYAARAASTGATPEGDLRILGENNAPVLDGQAWYGGNSGVSYGGAWNCSEWPEKQHEAERCGTHPVGMKRANRWGLHDMLGNVFEWMADSSYWNPIGPVTDPARSTGRNMVVRGGSWDIEPRFVRSAYRSSHSRDVRSKRYGFRLVRTE